MTSLTQFEFTQEKLDLLKNTVCKGASNHEFELFLHVCKRTGLDPFMKQIYSIPRGGQRTIQTAIDGFRLIAERTGRYSPGKESTYIYDEKGNLVSATSYIKKMTPDGTWHEISASAMFNEYCQGSNPFWKKMPHVMLAKCAEAVALRKGFPAELSGIYSKEEMSQADINSEDEEIKCEEITHSPEFIEKKMLEFLTKYADEDHDMIKTYFEKYSDYWKKSMIETLEIYSDQEKFDVDFSKWRKKQQENGSK